MSYDEVGLPWNDPSSWKPGEWFPMPVGYMARDFAGYIFDGYGIFELSPDQIVEGGDDICPAKGLDEEFHNGTITFSVALAICELKNGRRMLG